ncbi:hypothetical protein [Streptomyces sp. KL118A]|uniref:hypothetical protein n=1 Tax=Streptomyces sp. KL118A TaxID=3045153 RepID=UPI00278BE922|nr:hypothetical protein [Streptomyces sp. KL118A]
MMQDDQQYGQVPVRRPDPGNGRGPWARPSPKEIPYDHVAVLRLRGRAGNRVEDTINISVDGAFVATSIGYSFVPAPPTGGIVDGQAITLPPPFDALVGAAFNDPADAARCLFSRFCGIDFTYSIIDSGTGRELQNRAIHNIAGLGSSDGARPFRPMAKPMLFLPRSTIRIVVDEVSEGPLFQDAQLFFVLHGYKMLGYLP